MNNSILTDGPTTNCSTGQTQYSAEDTFNKLRRVDYNAACAEYCIFYLGYPIETKFPDEVLDKVLGPLGWTMEDLKEESDKRKANGD